MLGHQFRALWPGYGVKKEIPIHTINFSSLDQKHPTKLSGTLDLPENNSSPCPAIAVVHGTIGIDSRGAFYRESILKAWIAFFEADFKTGILRKLPTIDPDRIGIMGF